MPPLSLKNGAGGILCSGLSVREWVRAWASAWVCESACPENYANTTSRKPV